MKKYSCITPVRYRFARRLYQSREIIGWLITALICFLLWFVNHENQRLSAEITETRIVLNEKNRRIAGLRQFNEENMTRLQALEVGQRQILQKLDEEKCHARQQ